jgi:hypothetical protein
MLRIITGMALMSIFGFTSCQNEVNDVQEIIQMLQIQLLPTT